MADPALWGLVLAGGRSQRLGRDKAAIRYQGEYLLDRAVRLLQPFVAEVRVSVRAEQADDAVRRGYALVRDAHDDIGPAAGMLAAHRVNPAVAWLVLACDMPKVTEREIDALVRARDATRAATAFRQAADGIPEPLCAIYEPATLARFQEQVDAGGNPSPRDWLAMTHPVLLDQAAAGVLASVNMPADLERLVRRAPGNQDHNAG